MSTKHKSLSSYAVAFLSAVYMGLGQLVNRQWLKGLLFMAFQTLLIIPIGPTLIGALKGLITLGEVPMRDHSLFMMIYGIIAVLFALFIVAIYIANIKDAYRTREAINRGQQVDTARDTLRNLGDIGFPYLVMTPGLLCIIFFTFLPMVFNILIAFTNYDLYNSPPRHILKYVKFNNFAGVLTTTTWANTFKNVLIWTVIWATLSTLTTYVLGGLVAIVLNNPRLKFRKTIRTILILPYAIPGFVSILIWRGMLNTNFGIINKLLIDIFNISPIGWFENVFWARTATILVNLWLGFPYAMMVITGVLQGIPDELYEAATVDGASSFQRFRHITMPLVVFAIAPLMIMSFAFNFNNFDLIYLLNSGNPPVFGQQGGAGGTDILISWVYKLTFDKLKFNYAAAISLMIFFFISGFSIYNYTRTQSYREEEMLQ